MDIFEDLKLVDQWDYYLEQHKNVWLIMCQLRGETFYIWVLVHKLFLTLPQTTNFTLIKRESLQTTILNLMLVAEKSPNE